jgi:CheY-like chemotaxis protein
MRVDHPARRSTLAVRRSGPILIVDDDSDWRSTLQELLVARGYSVVEAGNGRTALSYLTSGNVQPALVLLDLQMPGMNGWDLLTVLQMYLRLSAIPIVVVSGATTEPPSVGVARYFKKPVDVDALLEAVDDLMGGGGDGFVPPTPRPFGSSPTA